jgi:hypothetical protein
MPPLNLSASIAHIGTTLLYLNLPPMYISLNRSHPLQSHKATLSTHHSPLTCTLHDTFIVPLPPTYVHISQQVTPSPVSQSNPLYTSLTPHMHTT